MHLAIAKITHKMMTQLFRHPTHKAQYDAIRSKCNGLKS